LTDRNAAISFAEIPGKPASVDFDTRIVDDLLYLLDQVFGLRARYGTKVESRLPPSRESRCLGNRPFMSTGADGVAHDGVKQRILPISLSAASISAGSLLFTQVVKILRHGRLAGFRQGEKKELAGAVGPASACVVDGDLAMAFGQRDKKIALSGPRHGGVGGDAFRRENERDAGFIGGGDTDVSAPSRRRS